MVQQLRKPTALAKDLGSVPTPTLAHIARSRSWNPFPASAVSWTPMVHTHASTHVLGNFLPTWHKLELSKKREP